ncbi:uncharacterized protein LOC122667150 [Telopea speciosissima]|uniref:uncharacterized protein LOC122667150 n=1 Tax=Telopea speciosissima TaxID=54955 RepID=UPI001CC4D0C9|nr:uncharacterized protein LOC122667150 [Telopea speciosissima]
MGLVPRFRPTMTQCRIKHLHRGGITVTPHDQLIIKLPDSRVLTVIARSVLLALAIITSPWLGSMVIRDSSLTYSSVTSEARIHGESLLPVLLHDFTSEGLFKSGDKALFVIQHGDGDEVTTHGAQILKAHDMDLVSESDAERQNSILDGTFDFVIASGFIAGEFIDRILKTGGIVAIQLSNNPSNAFYKPSNYKIMYLRQFESTVLALRRPALLRQIHRRRGVSVHRHQKARGQH